MRIKLGNGKYLDVGYANPYGDKKQEGSYTGSNVGDMVPYTNGKLKVSYNNERKNQPKPVKPEPKHKVASRCSRGHFVSAPKNEEEVDNTCPRCAGGD